MNTNVASVQEKRDRLIKHLAQSPGVPATIVDNIISLVATMIEADKVQCKHGRKPV